MFEIAGGIILAVLFFVVGLPLAIFVVGLILRYLKEILIGILVLVGAGLLFAWMLNAPPAEADDPVRNLAFIRFMVPVSFLVLLLSVFPLIMTALLIYLSFLVPRSLIRSVLVSILCILVIIGSIGGASLLVDDFIELGVDSQQVVLGETESTDGCLIFNPAMRSMEVVSMRPVIEACGSVV